MMRLAALVAALLFTAGAAAQPVKLVNQPIRFTEPPALKPEPIPPEPRPDPNAPLALDGDTLLVVDSDSDLLAWSFPLGVLSVTKEQGPITIRGKFAGGTGKNETRKFAGKHVLVVEAVGNGDVCLLVMPAGATTEADGVVKRIRANVAPRPPPKPPEPTPPAPDKPPIAAAGFRVLIVYETGDLPKYPPAQQAVFYSDDVRSYLRTHCAVGLDGKTAEARVFDQNTPMANESKLWQDAMARPRKSLPWIVVSNGKTGTEEPLPANVADAMALLRKYGGP